MERLKDKVAIITGGAQGIGAITAAKFLIEKAHVIIWDVNNEAGEAVAANLGANASFMKVNVSDKEQVEKAVSEVLEKYNKIDILINNAGITRDSMFHKMEEQQWDQVIDINLKGVFLCGQSVAKVMREQGNGVIINTSSVVAHNGNFGQSNYVAAKSGIIGMTKVWARELGGKGVRVNAVAPGFIATEMVKSVPAKVISMLEEKTPLGRLGNPEDIANAYLFLSSDEAAYVTGAVLNVDGGLVL
ncbi:MAG: beta-ketoacyl-ACP reductase [Calditrichaeota bacterium]|nr:MAG: beta-ketoacyl-ACP reductase [Calditrichota bacterium]MBL1206038.1 beta-ketoacyl-ACP reductase [Calditrichota bacterium]NOG45866.1 beta-ketoacyl-ACP reductase [Calditrichota bacterium]